MDVVRGKTMGLVGFGTIGKEIARLARAFGIRVLALRRNPLKSDPDGDALVERVLGFEDRLQLFEESDFVVCSLPNTPSTYRFVGKHELALMRNGSVLVNIGRGQTVDEAALTSELLSGRLFAALDVFEKEPLPTESPLWQCENAIISAHTADQTGDFSKLGWSVWLDNFEAFKLSKPLPTLVDKVAGY